MTNLNYSIWLQIALGAGAKVSQIFSVFSDPEEIYRSTEKELRLSGAFTEKQISRLCTSDPNDTYSVMEKCAKMGVDILTPDSDMYPEKLLEIDNFPVALYVKGDISCLSRGIPFGIVGTRKPVQPESMYATRALSGSLSVSGFTVVSGGALGIDSAAHTAAISHNGETVAVLGSGIGAEYLRKNEALRNAVSQNGALISEFLPCTEPHKGCFPIRNRLIAALSEGVAVMEGGARSGSLITAKYAYEMGRDVFVLPCDFPTLSNQGVYELMRDGAKPIKCAMDVVEEYLMKFPGKVIIDENIDLFQDIKNPDNSFLKDSDFSENFEEFENGCTETFAQNESLKDKFIRKDKKVKSKVFEKRKLADTLSDSAHRIYDCFGTEPLSINDIAEAEFMPTSSVLGALTELEIFGYIELLPDTKYILKQEG